MLAQDRQLRLDPILKELEQIEGVETVAQDDFNSFSVRVFLSLKTKRTKQNCYGHAKPAEFERKIRHLKRDISKCGVLDFSHQPIKRYCSSNGERYDMGYDCNYIQIEVYV